MTLAIHLLQLPVVETLGVLWVTLGHLPVPKLSPTGQEWHLVIVLNYLISLIVFYTHCVNRGLHTPSLVSLRGRRF